MSTPFVKNPEKLQGVGEGSEGTQKSHTRRVAEMPLSARKHTPRSFGFDWHIYYKLAGVCARGSHHARSSSPVKNIDIGIGDFGVHTQNQSNLHINDTEAGKHTILKENDEEDVR